MSDSTNASLPQSIDDVAEYLDDWFAYRLFDSRTTGIQVAIRRGDELVYSNSFGHADIENEVELTNGHIMRVASHSKWFTATAIMQLRQSGHIRLDDKLYQHIGWVDSPEYGKIGDVTISQLMSHNSSIVRDGQDTDFWNLDAPYPDVARLKQILSKSDTDLVPYREFKYSNIGYSLLGLVVESASGVSYEEFVQHKILDVVGLENTYPELNAEVTKRAAIGYSEELDIRGRTPYEQIPSNAMKSAAGCFSNAEDLSMFGTTQYFGNNLLLSDDDKREMQYLHGVAPADQEGYGLGLLLTNIDDRRLVGHSGGCPGYISRTYVDPVDQFVVSVLGSCSGAQASNMAQGVVKLINLAEKSARQRGDRSPASRDWQQKLYRTANAMHTVVLGGRVHVVWPNGDDPTTSSIYIDETGDETGVLAGTNPYYGVGEPCSLMRDDDGQVIGLRMAGMPYVIASRLD